jgi:hypothetical protein
MANVSKLIFGAAISVASIATPALAAHKGQPISAHHNGYVTRNGLYNFAPVPPAFNSAAQPHDTPFSGGGFWFWLGSFSAVRLPRPWK